MALEFRAPGVRLGAQALDLGVTLAERLGAGLELRPPPLEVVGEFGAAALRRLQLLPRALDLLLCRLIVLRDAALQLAEGAGQVELLAVFAGEGFDFPSPVGFDGTGLALVEVSAEGVAGQGIEGRGRDLGRVRVGHGFHLLGGDGPLGRAELLAVEVPAAAVSESVDADAEAVRVAGEDVEDPAGVPQAFFQAE